MKKMNEKIVNDSRAYFCRDTPLPHRYTRHRSCLQSAELILFRVLQIRRVFASCQLGPAFAPALLANSKESDSRSRRASSEQPNRPSVRRSGTRRREDMSLSVTKHVLQDARSRHRVDSGISPRNPHPRDELRCGKRGVSRARLS